ncbi:MAG: thymidylate synthase [Halonotius sp. J07HN4]|nr:MAG: thymidylate synthase [Halonotius sp. J07HN4]
MQQYLDLVADTLAGGSYKPNRTGVDTIASFSQGYTIDLQEGFPLLTTKDLSGFRWNSLIHEFRWYLSGEEHIRNLREETGIWDAWADEQGRLDTAYGRFWRRFPVPEEGLDGEAWPDDDHRWRNEDGTFDQIQYVIDTLQESPNSRRLVVSAWHPANAAVSTLPPCHYTFVFNVQGDKLNCHLTQRSGDIALGVPFNIAAYALLTHAVAQETGFTVGEFGHTVVDAHIYCGAGDRGDWYADNLDRLRSRLADVDDRAEYTAVREWLEAEAPEEPADSQGYDHVPGLLTQLSREPRRRPAIEMADKPLDALGFDDIELLNYNPADGISFAVAE